MNLHCWDIREFHGVNLVLSSGGARKFLGVFSLVGLVGFFNLSDDSYKGFHHFNDQI